MGHFSGLHTLCNGFAAPYPCAAAMYHLLLSQNQISMKVTKAIIYSVLLAGTVCSCLSPRHVMNYMGHEYVDLGLSVVWATCNVGAERPEDIGSDFTWGATEESVQEVSSLSDITSAGNRPYNIEEMVKKSTLKPEYDAARVQWGGYWRMPTRYEMDELIDHCTWTWTTVNGVKGYRITSKIRGHKRDSIFLPANEEYTTYTTYEGETDYRGHYWTSTKYAFVRDVTFMYFWSTNDVRIGWCASQNEMPIRPVIPLKAVSIQRL